MASAIYPRVVQARLSTSPVLRFAVVGIAVAATVAVSGCGSGKSAKSTAPCGSAPRPAAAANFKPVVPNTLTITAHLPSPGYWEFSDENPDQLDEGYEFDLAKCLQEQFGLRRLSVRNASVDAVLSGKVKGYDISLSQITTAPNRAKSVSFSVPYFEPRESVLMRATGRMSTLTEARSARWGVQSGSPASALLHTVGVTQPHEYKSLSDASAALQSKEIDAFLADNAISFVLAGISNGRLHLAAQFSQPNAPGVYRAALPKGSTNVKAVNAVFNSLRDSGELNALLYRDLGADPGPIPLIAVPAT